MANDNQLGRDRDLVLAPGEYAYVKDTTKGHVNTYVGPFKVSMSNTDQPVVWDTTKRRFVDVGTDKAVQTDSIAPEGFYIALYNPAENYPIPGTATSTVKLQVGHRVNIHGPVNFSLWPGQTASVIRGHHLHSNQYLLAQVYNDVAANANWKEAVVKSPDGSETVVEPRTFTPGQLLIIKGTDVSFFMPPTGIKVVPESDSKLFVRDAVTIERLEYCILLDEDGNKRFVVGPDVVFPEPTEQFVVGPDGSRKFRAIELNETTGIYIKVIADYTDEKTGVKHKAGDELFITGKEQAIYVQREEHSVIRYGDQTKHYAVAVPAGEGRYVLNRTTGVISLVRGPKMLLCDPRTEVIVRRVLAEGTARLWYPNNEKVVQINKELEAANLTAIATSVTAYAAGLAAMPMAAPSYTSTGGTRGLAALNYQDEVAAKQSRQIMGDTFQRGTAFTPPRTITLDTKYEGAVSINVWTGYAVLIVNKTGQRRVVIGPSNLLLEYDETLAPLELSTGTPKSTEKLFRTVYLLVHNNRVSDLVQVETHDLVKLNLRVAYRVNFEGDNPEKWFEVENYVRLLSDHMRSLIRNAVKRKGVIEFYSNAIDIVRDTALGVSADGKRPGRAFSENNMRVYDLEVLDVAIVNPEIAKVLANAEMESLKQAVQISQEEQTLAYTKKSEGFKRELAEEKARTAQSTSASAVIEISALFDSNLARLMAETNLETSKLKEQMDQQETLQSLNAAYLKREKETEDQAIALATQKVELELKRIIGESEQIAKRAQSVSPDLIAALTTFSDQSMIEKVSSALGPMAAFSGVSVIDLVSKLFQDTPFAQTLDVLATRARIPAKTS